MLRFAYSTTALRALLLRAFAIWALVRVLITAIYLLRPPVNLGNAVVSPSPALIVVLGSCALVATVDAARRHEQVLWGNLGLSFRALLLVQLVAATAGEAGLHLVRHWRQ